MVDETSLDKYLMIADSGKVIFREGDSGSHIYIIRTGSVKISKKSNGKEFVLTVLGKGDFFGEMALVSAIDRTATATAVTTTELLVLNRRSFLEMIQKNGNIALNIIDKLCKRLQNTNQQLKLVAERDTAGLFAQNLYYAFSNGEGGDNPVNYLEFFREMSLNLEIPQQHINLLLESFKSQRIIDIVNAKIILLDKDKLMQLAKISKKA